MKRLPLGDRYLVSLLTLGAFALWLAAIGNRSLWADEFATNRIMERPDFASMLAYTPLSERRPPLYYILLWWWQVAAGSSEFAFRYLSLMFSVLSVPLFWAFARSAARISGGLKQPPNLAVWLLVSSPVVALFGIMIRNFPMMLAVSLLTNWLFVRWITRTVEDPRRAGGLAWLVSTVVLIWTDYHAWAIIGAQVVWILIMPETRERLWRPMTMWLGIALLSFVPLVLPLVEQVERTKLEADLSRDAAGLFLRLTVPFFVFPFGETILPWHPAVLLAAPVVVILVLRALAQHQTRPLMLLCVLLIVAPVTFNVTVLTVIATDLTFLAVASRTLAALPPLLLLIASGLSTLSGRARYAALSILFLANGAALFNLWLGIEYHNPIYAVPLRSLHADLARRTMAGDVIVSDFDIVYQYYYSRDPIPGTSLILTEEENLPAIALAISTGTPRIWLFIFGRDRSLVGDRTPMIRAWLDAAGYASRTTNCYAPTDPIYRTLKERLIPRRAYECKLMVTLYESMRQ